MSKDSLILIQVARPFHPMFSIEKWTDEQFILYEGCLKTEEILAQSMAVASEGKLTYIGGSSITDFTDGSDCKSGSIRSSGSGKWTARVTNVGKKPGAVRAVIYNQFLERLEHFFIPDLKALTAGTITFQNKSGDYNLEWNYSVRSNSHGKFGQHYGIGYGTDDFVILSQM